MIYSAITNNKDKPRKDINCFGSYNRFKEPVLNAKIYKVLSHLFIDDEYSIWVDGNVFLKKPEEEFIKLLGDSDIAVFKHPWHKNLFEEANYCIEHSIGDKKTIEKQIRRYKDFSNDELGWCGLIIRRHTEKIKRLNEQWWAEICRGSVRDQISFPYVFSGVVKYLPKLKKFYDNEYYERRKHNF